MKLVYIISQAHSGSTMTDCILGTHPEFISSGELRYLNWQLERTKSSKATKENQDCCTCLKNFRDCEYWSKVFEEILLRTGNDVVQDPSSFETAFFGNFSYNDRGGFRRSKIDKLNAYIFRLWIEKGYNYRAINFLEPKLKRWIDNNWLLYNAMSEVAKKPIVIDSSKHLLIALLLQQYKPDNVYLLFIHRSLNGLAASYKKWAKKSNKDFSIQTAINSKNAFEKKISNLKNLKNLRYFEVNYEDIVRNPSDFVADISKKIGANLDYEKQSNNNFFINPSKQHLVAGNPMRYKGEQLIKYDESWKNRLTEEEIDHLKKCMK